MARRDKIHEAVKKALTKDGWKITADPYKIKYKSVRLEADLAADRTIAAECGTEQIVVEIKSFLGASPIHELQAALRQYQMYLAYLKRSGSARQLFLAISHLVWEEFFLQEAITELLEEYQVRLIVVGLQNKEIKLWKR